MRGRRRSDEDVDNPEGQFRVVCGLCITYNECMNNAHDDLFDLMTRWDVEAKAIPAYLLRRGTELSRSERTELLVRMHVLKKLTEELRDAMAKMAARYRGVIDGDVVVEATTEDKVWAIVHDQGVVEFSLMTDWLPTDRSIQHRSPDLDNS